MAMDASMGLPMWCVGGEATEEEMTPRGLNGNSGLAVGRSWCFMMIEGALSLDAPHCLLRFLEENDAQDAWLCKLASLLGGRATSGALDIASLKMVTLEGS